MNRIALLLRAAVTALLCLPFLVQAQAKVGDRFGDWVFECVALAEGKTACALTYLIVSKKDNQRIAQLSLGRHEAKGGIVLTAFLPLGIYLPAGASGSIDQGKPFQFTLETCLPRQGCIGTFSVNVDFLKSLRSAKQLDIGFAAADGRKPVTLGASLIGLAEGLKAAKLE